LHFDGSHEPRPLADRARNFLTGELHLTEVAAHGRAAVDAAIPVDLQSCSFLLVSVMA
jgi:hypothetical protein